MQQLKSPIAVFVYNRPKHTAECLKALQECVGADVADLIVFSDGAKGAEDCEAVEEVRDLVRSTTGFASVRMVAREANLGLARSIIGGVTEVLAEHESVIVVEDDIIFHPDALHYFSATLNAYRDNHGVFSISGYNYPPSLFEVPEWYEYDVYMVPRMVCWGWATWRNRWQKGLWNLQDYMPLWSCRSMAQSFAYHVGLDVYDHLRAYSGGKLDVWACRWAFAHFRNNALCMCPTQSYVNNVGFDGSGVHCGVADRYSNVLGGRRDVLRLPPAATVDPAVFQAFMKVPDPEDRRLAIVAGERRLPLADGAQNAPAQ